LAPTNPEPPFAIRGIDHVVLRIRDLDRVTRFYRDVLGCALAAAPARHGRVQPGHPRRELHGCPDQVRA